MNVWSEAIPVMFFFGSVVYIFKIFYDYRIKSRLIEKGLSGDDARKIIGYNHSKYSPSSLKWGLILFLVGLAIVIVKVFPDYIDEDIIFGVTLLAAGVGLLIYYGIAGSKNKPEENNRP